jgi:hypothetical protein
MGKHTTSLFVGYWGGGLEVEGVSKMFDGLEEAGG